MTNQHDTAQTALDTIPQQELASMRPSLDTARDVLLYSLSETSKRIYDHTYQQWQAFAASEDIPARDMRPQHIIQFLESADIAFSTKQARLSHLRKLLETLHAQRPDNVEIESMYKQAKLLKIKRSDEDKTADEKTRQGVALERKQVYEAFNVWSDDSKLHARNRALLAVLFYGGLRRSEARALRWDDIDLKNGLIHIRHGKGDKSRTVPLLGGSTPVDYLRDWYQQIAARRYVFPALRRGDNLADDTPMTAKTVYRVVRRTGNAIGVDIAPHDARRTLITNALNAGTAVNDVQFIAGHERAETTLGYAVTKDAKSVQGRAKIDY